MCPLGLVTSLQGRGDRHPGVPNLPNPAPGPATPRGPVLCHLKGPGCRPPLPLTWAGACWVYTGTGRGGLDMAAGGCGEQGREPGPRCAATSRSCPPNPSSGPRVPALPRVCTGALSLYPAGPQAQVGPPCSPPLLRGQEVLWGLQWRGPQVQVETPIPSPAGTGPRTSSPDASAQGDNGGCSKARGWRVLTMGGGRFGVAAEAEGRGWPGGMGCTVGAGALPLVGMLPPSWNRGLESPMEALGATFLQGK